MTASNLQVHACKFRKAWIGACGKVDCEEHSELAGLACCSCGARATHECEETDGLVCGHLLCDNCEHRIHEDGTSRGGRHVRKNEQVNIPWYARPVSDLEESSILPPKFDGSKLHEWIHVDGVAPFSPYEGGVSVSDMEQRIVDLERELGIWKPLTPEQAEEALDAVIPSQITSERIREIIDKATDPAYSPPNSELVELAASNARMREVLFQLLELDSSSGKHLQTNHQELFNRMKKAVQ